MTTSNINQLSLVGRLGQKPDVKWFESGAVIAKVSLAVNRRSRNKNEMPNWFPLECWGKTAEILADYTDKGSLIGVEGELKFDEWTDKNTNEIRVKPVIKVNRLELLSSINTNTSSQNQSNDDDDDF
ncbi:MAG: single-stranded DNA-binding protein [Crocosphaera sp.]